MRGAFTGCERCVGYEDFFSKSWIAGVSFSFLIYIPTPSESNAEDGVFYLPDCANVTEKIIG